MRRLHRFQTSKRRILTSITNISISDETYEYMVEWQSEETIHIMRSIMYPQSPYILFATLTWFLITGDNVNDTRIRTIIEDLKTSLVMDDKKLVRVI